MKNKHLNYYFAITVLSSLTINTMALADTTQPEKNNAVPCKSNTTMELSGGIFGLALPFDLNAMGINIKLDTIYKTPLFNNKLAVVLSNEFLSRPLTSNLIGLKVGLNARYYIFDSGKFFNPYISLGPQFSFVDNTEAIAKNAANAALTTASFHSVPFQNPAIGAELAFGSDFNLTPALLANVALRYNSYFRWANDWGQIQLDLGLKSAF